jgi:hypothetical protein
MNASKRTRSSGTHGLAADRRRSTAARCRIAVCLVEDGLPEATALSTLRLSRDDVLHYRQAQERLQFARAVDKLATIFRQRVDSARDGAVSPDEFIDEVAEALRRALSKPHLDLIAATSEGHPEHPAVPEAAGPLDAFAAARDGSDCDPPGDHLEEVA